MDFGKSMKDLANAAKEAAQNKLEEKFEAAKEALEQKISPQQQPTRQQPPRPQNPPANPAPAPSSASTPPAASAPQPRPVSSEPWPNRPDKFAYGTASMSQRVGTSLYSALGPGSTSIIMGSDSLDGSTGYIWDLKVQPGHAMTFGPTRKGGKGVSAIIPALLSYTGGSRLVIDPKGENYFAVKDQADRAGHRVVLMDPWNEANRRYAKQFDYAAVAQSSGFIR